MQLLSRVMGTHKLCILGFYTYVLKYLTHHQLRVTIILVSLAQSVHDLTPPDALTPVVRKLAQEFVHPGVGKYRKAQISLHTRKIIHDFINLFLNRSTY
jgi:protein SDA1